MSAHSLSSIDLRYERDVVQARQRAREVAKLLAFDHQDQIRLATATSEIARNAFRYARRGKIEFSLQAEPQEALLIVVKDEGPGIDNLQDVLAGRYKSETGLGMGIVGTRRLMDSFEVKTSPEGTLVTMSKRLPSNGFVFTIKNIKKVVEELNNREPDSPFEEIERQNQELLKTLADLRARQEELALLNRELEDTNRGVVALYAELDERADYLRRASELKTNFISNMSHEFRTPLNSIISLTRILQAKSDGDLNGEQETQVRFIQRSAQELSELVNDLLDLAKVEAGKVEVKPKTFQISDLFGSLRGMLRPLLVDSSLDLVFDNTSVLPAMYTDEGKVSQILRNFISNALKFTSGGEIRISASLGTNHTIIFSVRDTGIGIAPEDLDIVFNEFTQIESPLQDKVKGTGLGLPLCRNLASLLGGRVSVESELGKGSVFYAVIPIAYRDGKEEVTEAGAIRAVPPGKVPVLIIEDNPETVFVYETYLQNTEFHPFFASSLAQARIVLAEGNLVAIIMDLNLAGENSADFILELRADARTKGTPVIVISVMEEDVRRVLSYGANLFLRKPVEQEKFYSSLHALTGGERRKKVLLVDDNEVSRYVLREQLSAWNFQFFEARSGREALRLISQEMPDLIFLDLLMPDISGFQVLDELRTHELARNIPIIIHSSKLLDSVEGTRIRAQALGVFPKQALNETFASRELQDLLQKAGMISVVGR